MPPLAAALSPKFPKSHPEHSPSSPCLKSLVLAPAARNNRTGKGREKGSPSAAKHINLQIYLVGIIPEGETDPILHHPTNCPHLFGDSNRRPGTCARSGSEATCPCFPGSLHSQTCFWILLVLVEIPSASPGLGKYPGGVHLRVCSGIYWKFPPQNPVCSWLLPGIFYCKHQEKYFLWWLQPWW